MRGKFIMLDSKTATTLIDYFPWTMEIYRQPNPGGCSKIFSMIQKIVTVAVVAVFEVLKLFFTAILPFRSNSSLAGKCIHETKQIGRKEMVKSGEEATKSKGSSHSISGSLKPPLSNKELWNSLQKKTCESLKNLSYAMVSEARFGNVPCPRETAICLDEGKFLHANEVGMGHSKRLFIASQAPHKTEHPTFWQLALRRDCLTIVDLVKTEEAYKMDSPYYPGEVGETIYYEKEKVSVTLLSVEDCVHTYKVTDGQKTKTIKRYHYVNWPDQGVVPLESFKTLIQRVETLSSNDDQMVWVHCRAGVGRTGSLITALILKEKIRSGEMIRDNVDEDLINLILELRQQRGGLFVQTREQFGLLREYANFLLESR
jgi:protein tyrosine phosphatase